MNLLQIIFNLGITFRLKYLVKIINNLLKLKNFIITIAVMPNIIKNRLFQVIMFVREKKIPRSLGVSVQLVESFREDGKIKQRVVRHVGTADTPEKLEALKQLALCIKEELLSQRKKPKTSAKKESYGSLRQKLTEVSKSCLLRGGYIEELQRYVLGIHDVYGFIYEQLGFSHLFSPLARSLPAEKILREVVLARIAYPDSKRASVEQCEKKFGVKLQLAQVYRMMDKIDNAFCKRVQQCALNMALKLSGNKVRVLFYDATTLYFESFIEDELKQNGYSKDMKFNQAQVLLAVYITENGLPVGYELFPGAMFEGHTLIPVLKKLKERYQLEEVVFVADRGLFNEENLSFLEENGIRYIVGARIKNVAKKLQNEILDLNNYQVASGKNEQRVALFAYGEGRQLIVNYQRKRASKDSYERQKAIEKLKKKLAKSSDPKSLINNYGYKKYIEIKGDTKIHVNEDKIKKDSRWDGLQGVITNIPDPIPEQILMHYRNLWRIEECFRINKHDLKIRPIYHWKPQRIKAHIAIAFMAFVCVRYLEYRLAIQSQKLSPKKIKEALLDVQGSVILDKKSGQQFILPSKIDPSAKEIYRALQISLPRGLLKCNA